MNTSVPIVEVTDNDIGSLAECTVCSFIRQYPTRPAAVSGASAHKLTCKPKR